MTLGRSGRYSKDHPCRVCGGYPSAKRTHRCTGWLNEEGRTAYCSSSDKAHGLPQDPESLTYPHLLGGLCGCSVRHLAGLTRKASAAVKTRPGCKSKRPTSENDNAEESEEEQSSESDALADKLIRLAREEDLELFSDTTGEPWARLKLEDHHQIWSCDGRQFKRWLARLYWETHRKALNSQVIGTALNVLTSQAVFDGAKHELHNRVARQDGAIWYDLSDESWRVVRITATDWNLVSNPPILFRRYSHQASQVIPVVGGDLHRVLDFMNLTDARHQLLFLVDLVFCLIPDVPHPIPVLFGPQGSAKTTAFRMRRRIIDPSEAETLSMPTDKTEMVQMLAHHWMPLFDNITTIPDWASDVLCRASTGEGSSKRILYTDEDDLIYKYKRCCGLNGINIAAQKPDLLDRCLFFNFDSIPDERRRLEEDLWDKFESERPRLIGAALTALSKSMAIKPSIKLGRLHRMADFTLWGCAIAEALGHSRAEFLEAMEKNFSDRNEEVLSSNPIASMVIALMEEHDSWEGTPRELFVELKAHAEKHHIDTRTKPWPRAPQVLTRRLNEIKPNLAAVGIQKSGGQGRRGLRLSKSAENTVRSVLSVRDPAGRGAGLDGTDGVDGISGTPSGDRDMTPCPKCKGTRFYLRHGGTVTCGDCFPPVGKVEWLMAGDSGVS